VNWWSAIMEAFQPAFLYAAAVGLLIWGVLLLPKMSGRSKMSLIWGLLLAGVIGANFVGAVGSLGFLGGPAVLKYGPSRAEIRNEVTKRVSQNLKGVDYSDYSYYKAAYDLEQSAFLPPPRVSWYFVAGIFVFLGTVLVRFQKLGHLAEGAVTPPDWMLIILGEEDRESNKNGECRMALSKRVSQPCSWAPRWIILPELAKDWPEEDVRLAIRHEVSHIRDRHCSSVLMAQGLTCMSWCFPWMWFLSGAVRRLSERAADEAVVAAGSDPIAYAELLLRLGKSASKMSSLALPIVEPAGVRDRVKRLLEGTSIGKDWGRRGVWTGIAMASIVGLVVGLSARSYGMLTPVEHFQTKTILELSPKNGFRGIDKDGFECRVTEVIQKRDGAIMRWTPEDGWKPNKEELGLELASIESGTVRLAATIAGWPVKGEDARVYSLTNGNAIAWDAKITTQIYGRNINKGITNLVYSRSPWKEVGRLDIGGTPEGRIAEFNEIKVGEYVKDDHLKDNEREFMIDYGQIYVPSTPAFEFGYEWKIIDRGATDRRVLFVMQDGSRIETRQYVRDQSSITRDVWRAYVDPKNVVGVVMEERPAMRLEISGLPSAN
jgi:hypothetical protein